MLLNGKAPLPGQVMKFPNLANTFRTLVEHGKDGFYKGHIANAIVDLIKSKGGVMELEDLAAHKTSFVEPIKYTYAGEVTVYEVRCNLYRRSMLHHFISALLMAKVIFLSIRYALNLNVLQASPHFSLLVFWSRFKLKGR